MHFSVRISQWISLHPARLQGRSPLQRVREIQGLLSQAVVKVEVSFSFSIQRSLEHFVFGPMLTLGMPAASDSAPAMRLPRFKSRPDSSVPPTSVSRYPGQFVV